MLQERASSTTSGFHVCGGYEISTYNSLYNCEKFDPSNGTWSEWVELDVKRTNHVAWEAKEGLFLIGGRGSSCKTSTFIDWSGTIVEPGFDLAFDTSQ